MVGIPFGCFLLVMFQRRVVIEYTAHCVSLEDTAFPTVLLVFSSPFTRSFIIRRI